MNQNGTGDQALAEAAATIERLVKEAERLPDERARTLVVELLQELLHLYGRGWQRMLDLIGRHDQRLLASVTQDDLLRHLLLLHDLHPVSLAQRIAGALNEVRPALEAHGGNVELLGLDGMRVRLRLTGSCHGCPSSTVTLKTTVEEALRRAAPELEAIEVDGLQSADRISMVMGP